MSIVITIREDYNTYTPRGVYVDEKTWKWVAVREDGRVAGCFKTALDAFVHMGPNGLIPVCRLMKSSAYNKKANVFAGMKMSIDEPDGGKDADSQKPGGHRA